MGDLEDFRTDFLGRQTQAEEALVHGDVEPRLALWSRRDPVTLLGGWGPNKAGWAERREDGEWKIVHRHGDLAPVDESPPANG